MIVRLHAPLGGWVMPIDQVPDPVFAEQMMGDGFAIDPLERVVRSPCDATVIAVAPTLHSISLRLENGAELLIHVGIDTVALAGEGFSAKVKQGDAVVTGQALIEFDLDAVAVRATSAVTPVVLVSDGFVLQSLRPSGRVAVGDLIAQIETQVATVGTTPPGEDTARCELTVPLANGIHARPAARIVAALKPFTAEVTIIAHGRSANARSIVALLAAGIGMGDDVILDGRGSDARAAVTAVARLLENSSAEEPVAAAVLAPATASFADGLIHGVCGSPGLAAGPVFHWSPVEIVVREQGKGMELERAALADALRTASIGRSGEGTAGAIAAAHCALFEDPELLAAASASIAQGKSAAFAWRSAIDRNAQAILATGDALLIERVADLKDVERQVVEALTGGAALPPLPPNGVILVAEEVLPSQMTSLSRAGVAGICTALGGPTSHAAILAASAGIPMVVAAGASVLSVRGGQMVILDADRATLDPSPDEAVLANASSDLVRQRQWRDADLLAAEQNCVTADGARIEIFANLASAADAATAVRNGAEGCGLLRTEFLFLDRESAPDEDEQCAAYAAVAAEMKGRPLIVRTLDIGGDKPVRYLPMSPEDNPALGMRGIRLSLARPDLLATQFRAILRGVPASQCRIMLPMIVDADELSIVRAILDRARAELGMTARIALGVMIETPAAAVLAESLARDADFLSIGSNDLTQYALAADRGNPAVARMVDALHPAVLHLIGRAAEGARAHGRWLGVCGGIASDPSAAALLIGLGVTELSAIPAAVPALKAAVRQLHLARCRELAAQALAARNAAEVRALLEEG